jgi:hypothetical protein
MAEFGVLSYQRESRGIDRIYQLSFRTDMIFTI